jgi:hypothetical protein
MKYSFEEKPIKEYFSSIKAIFSTSGFLAPANFNSIAVHDDKRKGEEIRVISVNFLIGKGGGVFLLLVFDD